jgi:hypothetical protein
VPTVFASAIIAEANNFKKGEFAHFWRKSAKKVSMLTVDSRDRCDYFFFHISNISFLSAPTVSASSIITETDDFKEGEFGIFWHKDCKEGEHAHCIFNGSMQLLFFSHIQY